MSSSMDDVLACVEDEVFRHLDMSAPAIVELFHDTALKCKNAAEFERVLRVSTGSEISGLNKEFYARVMDIVHNPAPYVAAKKAKGAARKRAREEPSPPLDGGVDPEEDEEIEGAPSKRRGKDGDVEELQRSSSSRIVTSADHTLDDAIDKEELDRLNSKLRGGPTDESKEKKSAAATGSVLEEQFSSLNTGDQREVVQQLRNAGRARYLQEREDRQLELQKRLLTAQEELLKYDAGVSQDELEKLEVQKKQYDLAVANKKQREGRNQWATDGGYQLPGSYKGDVTAGDQEGGAGPDRFAALSAGFYREDKPGVTEQEAFENDKLKQAMGQWAKHLNDTEKAGYDLIIENQVQFEELEQVCSWGR